MRSRKSPDYKKNFIFAFPNARIAQLVEHDLAKVGVAGSSPVSRSFFYYPLARVAELVDALDLKSSGHFGRTGSSPVPGTIQGKRQKIKGKDL